MAHFILILIVYFIIYGIVTSVKKSNKKANNNSNIFTNGSPWNPNGNSSRTGQSTGNYNKTQMWVQLVMICAGSVLFNTINFTRKQRQLLDAIISQCPHEDPNAFYSLLKSNQRPGVLNLPIDVNEYYLAEVATKPTLKIKLFKLMVSLVSSEGFIASEQYQQLCLLSDKFNLPDNDLQILINNAVNDASNTIRSQERVVVPVNPQPQSVNTTPNNLDPEERNAEAARQRREQLEREKEQARAKAEAEARIKAEAKARKERLAQEAQRAQEEQQARKRAELEAQARLAEQQEREATRLKHEQELARMQQEKEAAIQRQKAEQERAMQEAQARAKAQEEQRRAEQEARIKALHDKQEQLKHEAELQAIQQAKEEAERKLKEEQSATNRSSFSSSAFSSGSSFASSSSPFSSSSSFSHSSSSFGSQYKPLYSNNTTTSTSSATTTSELSDDLKHAYSLLKISERASNMDVERAFKTLKLKYSPSSSQARMMTNNQKQRNQEKLNEIIAAYELIIKSRQ